MGRLKDFKVVIGLALAIVFGTLGVEARFTKAADFKGHIQQTTQDRIEDKIERLERDKLFLMRPYQGDVKKATPYDKAIYDQILMELDQLYRRR